jgi:calcineurin-like phosphoesterase family protein
LLLGNHDRPFDALRKGQLDKHARWSDTYLEAGFDSITFGAQTISLPGVGEVMLSHFPYRGDHTAEDRFIDARPVDRGYPLLHGHVHEAWLQRGRMVNVGVDAWNFHPVAVADVVPLLLKR